MHTDRHQRKQGQKGAGASGILLVLFLAAVGGGIYWFWTKADAGMERVKSAVTGAALVESISGFFKKTPEEKAEMKEKGDSFVQAAIGTVITKPKEAAADFFADIRKSAVESARKEATELFGVPVGTFNQAANVSIVRPVRQSLLLQVEADTEDLMYAIDWGDTAAVSGSVPKKSRKSVDHSWSAPGDYTVTVEITGKDSGKKTYAFPITIQK